jgi:hypothetical protein
MQHDSGFFFTENAKCLMNWQTWLIEGTFKLPINAWLMIVLLMIDEFSVTFQYHWIYACDIIVDYLSSIKEIDIFDFFNNFHMILSYLELSRSLKFKIKFKWYSMCFLLE